MNKKMYFCFIYICVRLQMNILFISVLLMFIKDFQTKIQGKTYLQPSFNYDGYQSFFKPKLELKGMQHVYFNHEQIIELYKQKNMDPDNLECNLKYDPSNPQTINKQENEKVMRKQSQHKESQKQTKEEVKEEIPSKEVKIEKVNLLNNRPRPMMREKGFTHFIHIPFVEACRDTYQNIFKTQILEDQDILVPLNTLHATIMVFRLKSYDDLPRWEKILKSLKLRKVKANLRGVGIFPVKPNTNITGVFYVKIEGLDELIHDIVSKAIIQNLVTQKQLSFISFDKKIDMYKADQQHLTILKTKDKDLIDATPYLKMFNKLNIGKAAINDIRLSAIGSFDGQKYYDQIVVNADK